MALTTMPPAPVIGSATFAYVANAFIAAIANLVTELNALLFSAPITVTATTYTLGSSVANVINNCSTGSLVITMTTPTAGRVLNVKTLQAFTTVSSLSNVCPIGSATPGTAILAATAGKYAVLVGDGTNWITMEQG